MSIIVAQWIRHILDTFANKVLDKVLEIALAYLATSMMMAFKKKALVI
jgi:ribosome-associated toxin RatA of RatAB toxin-antitoxin module